MKGVHIAVGFIAAAAVFWFVSGGGDLGVTVNDDSVTVATGDIEASFTVLDSLDDSFMLFGGIAVDHKNAVSRIALTGLPSEEAQDIYDEYPEFYMCKSPGAAAAKSEVLQLNLVPVSASVFDTLETALNKFKENIRSGGERVCVSLKGSEMELDSVKVPAADEDLTDKFQGLDFYLVTEAEIVSWESVLKE